MKRIWKKVISIMLCLALSICGISVNSNTAKAVDRSKPWLLSANRPAYSSSNNGGDVATFATDGRLGTQWGASIREVEIYGIGDEDCKKIIRKESIAELYERGKC